MMKNSLLSDIENELTQNLCLKHSQTITKICSNSTCLKNYKTAFLCDDCIESHKKIHIEYNEYLNIQDIIPGNLENNISTMLIQNITNSSDFYMKIESIFESYGDYILNKLHEGKEQLKLKISNQLSHKTIIKNSQMLKSKIIEDNEHISSLSYIDPKMINYITTKKENIKTYLNLFGMFNKHKQDLDSKIESINQNIERLKQEIDFTSVFMNSKKPLGKKIRADSEVN